MRSTSEFQRWLSVLGVIVLVCGTFLFSAASPIAQASIQSNPQVAWSDIEGGNHGGADWIITADTTIAGVHTNIGNFVIQPEAAVSIKHLEASQYGFVEIQAKNIAVNGTLTANDAGYIGGAGGTGKDSDNPYCGGGGNSGQLGLGTYGGTAGSGGIGNSGTDENSVGCRYANGGNGDNGGNGGYLAKGNNGESTEQLKTDDVFIGSGGGGAGGGAAGSRYGENNGYAAGTGGGGGAGGRGAGYIKLISENTLEVSGRAEARGDTAGNGSGGGPPSDYICRTNEERNTPAYGGVGGDPSASGQSLGGAGRLADFYCPHPTGPSRTNTKGGNGGAGGTGAGGGILLKGVNVTLTGVINNLGGGDQKVNGGTLKIRYSGSYSAPSNFNETTGQTHIGFLQSEENAKRIHIEAFVDGRSQLIIRGNTVQWHHFDFAAPGRHGFVNLPTVINRVEWYPDWPDIPDAENRGCNCYSSILTTQSPLLPNNEMNVLLNAIQSRGTTKIVEYPTSTNNYTLIIEFDDNLPGGSDWYIVDLDFGSKDSSIIITKDALPDSPRNFHYYGPWGDFYLDDPGEEDGDTIKNSMRYTEVMSLGVYTFSEAKIANWFVSDITCSPDSNVTSNLPQRSVTINPQSDERVVCSFSTKYASSLSVYLYWDMDQDGQRDPTEDFQDGWWTEFYDSSGKLKASNFTQNGGHWDLYNIRPGTYTVCQKPQTGWSNTQPILTDPAHHNWPCYTFELTYAQQAKLYFGYNNEPFVASANAQSAAEGVEIIQVTDPEQDALSTWEEFLAVHPGDRLPDEDEIQVEGKTEIYLPMVAR